MSDISESDWKAFKSIWGKAKDRLAKRNVDSLKTILNSADVYDIDKFDNCLLEAKELRKNFNYTFMRYSRSSAISSLGFIVSQGLVSEDEFKNFSLDLRIRLKENFRPFE